MRQLLALVFVLGLASSADAAAMRCGLKLLSNDASLEQTLSTCGPPATATHRIDHVVSARVGSDGQPYVVQADVVVDELHYDFGPHVFTYDLTFNNGHMVSMVKGGKGKPR